MGRPLGSKSKKPSPLKGRTYEEIYGQDEGLRRKEICKKTHRPGYSLGQKMPVEVRERMKKSRKIGGLRRGAGRGKKGYYKGIWCDSTWELAFVVWNIDHGIDIRRACIKLPYEFEEKIRYYYPDFLIEKKDLIEIKGYLNEQAKAKSRAYPEIKIIAKEDIKIYLEYVEQKIGSKDLTKLYDNI